MRRKLLLLPTGFLFLIALGFTSQVSVQRVAAEGATRETQPVYTTPDGFLLGPAVHPVRMQCWYETKRD
jgi:hypothetical protein